MVKLLYGIDVIEGLKTLADESVQCVVTSPPYWGLRDYGCGAGQLGIETTPEEFILKITEVFKEVKRVLRSDGTLWLNLGDSYNANTGAGFNGNAKRPKEARETKINYSGLKPKNLIGIPWRVALALQADGWYLRSDIIWAKPNPMPESVVDRPTKSHEYIFLLTKSAKYYYNADAIAEDNVCTDPREIQSGLERGPLYDYDTKEKTLRGLKRKNDETTHGANGSKIRSHHGNSLNRMDGKRNKRTVWEIATQPYPEAHFATFPMEIPKICILAGTPPRGIVLDPFSGSGTTGEVAVGLGRRYIGIDLNKEYEVLAKQRIGLFCFAEFA